MIICFTGIDGSGKTLQAQRLVARLNEAGYPAQYAWTGGRSYVSRPLIWAAKKLLKAPRAATTPGVSSSPQRAPREYGSYLSSTKRLLKHGWLRALWRQVSLVEHTGEILATVLPHLVRGRIVVCDRYIYDSLLGIAVLAGADAASVPAMLRLPRIYAVPHPDAWFLIDLPAAVAFARRSDVVDVAFLERRVPLYRAMAQTLGMQIVDGTATPDAIADEIWQRVQPLLGTRQHNVVRQPVE